MNIDTELEKLRRLRRVEAPPFLLTRIEQRIAASSAAAASPALRFSLIGALVVLALLNAAAVSSSVSRSGERAGALRIAQELHLTTSYDPYE
jgi:hypothetical protein